MKTVKIANRTRGVELAGNCGVADNLFTRVRGLLGRVALPEGEALLIVPCPSIHMFGMKFALDVVFVTRDHIVTDVVEHIAPGKAYVAKTHCGKPHAALELPAGTIARSGTQRGDQLSVEPV